MYLYDVHTSSSFYFGTLAFIFSLVAVIIFLFYRQNRMLKREQQDKANQLQTLNAIIQGQENEQLRIAGELHDGLAVDIASVNSFVHHLKPYLEPSEAGIRNFEAITGMLEGLYGNTRKISHRLLSANVETRGLVSALTDFIKQLNSESDVPVNFMVEREYVRMAPEKELLVFRIVQELIQNASRHSEATQIGVKILDGNNRWKFEVMDNGKGVYPGDDSKNYGTSLKSIEARIKLLNGDFIFETDRNTGTRATILI